jgi:hypothetical protein
MRSFIALILCVSALFTHAIEEERWKLRAQNNGVDVSTQKVNGSSIDRFKATAIIEADYEAVKEFILDYPNYPLWYENYKSGNILKRQDNGELLVRFIINAPFPIKDRDSVNQVFIKQNEERITIRLESQPNLIAKTKGLVRMSISSGEWKLVKAGNQTKVSLIYHADPEIPIPSWIANRYLVQGPLNSLLNLKKRIE